MGVPLETFDAFIAKLPVDTACIDLSEKSHFLDIDSDLSKLKKFTKLATLILQHTNVTSVGIKNLKGLNIKTLQVNGVEIDVDFACAVAELSLDTIIVSEDKITEEASSNLKEINKLSINYFSESSEIE